MGPTSASILSGRTTLTHRSGICLTILMCSGCAAHGNLLPPLPAEWPVDGVVVEPVDPQPGAPPCQLLPPLGAAYDPTCDESTLPYGDQARLAPAGSPFSPTGPLLPNPIFVPIADREAAWESMVDIMDDYFRIAGEERVQAVGGVLTEGRIVTYPQVGATLLEPHRPDSVGLFNRLHATFQTIRRTADLRVVPTEGGYQIGVVVEVQLEDLPHPEQATASAALIPGDTSPVSEEDPQQRPFLAGIWYPIGRDMALEQRILGEIRACLDVAPPGVVY
jgi:hypothetical protein